MFFQSAAMVAKKLLVDDKITAWIKQICLLGVTCKVLNKKTLSGKTFCFLEKLLQSIFKFCALSNLGPVHTYTLSLENATFSLRIRLPSTSIQ